MATTKEFDYRETLQVSKCRLKSFGMNVEDENIRDPLWVLPPPHSNAKPQQGQVTPNLKV